MRTNFTETSIVASSLDSELSYNINRNYYYKQQIYNDIINRSFDSKLVSKVYKKLLQTLIAKFSNLVYIDDQENVKKIPCWHGSVERVIAKLKQDSNIILPVISVMRQADETADTRRRIDSLVVFETYFDKVKNRAVRVASLAQTPTDIKYKINVWTKYYEDMDQVCEQVRRFFNPHLLVSTIYNEQAIAYLDTEASNVDITLAEGKDRLIRRTFDITLQTYIPNPRFIVTNTGVIEEFNMESVSPK